jgi:anthranilate/para-aminobenzoate synthase component I
VDDKIYSTFYLYKNHKQLVCTEASKAFIQYKNFRIDLISGKRSTESVSNFMEELAEFKVGRYYEKPHVLHLFYEFGFMCVELFELIEENKPLAIYIEYESVQVDGVYDFDLDENLEFDILSMPNFEDYEKKFKETYKHLHLGDCYQLNLTRPFYFRCNKELTAREYIDILWRDALKVGAYAHGTYIDSLGKLLLSNSPECLFQIDKSFSEPIIRTMPIKGTVQINHEAKREEAWSVLTNSRKDQAELFMITDLMRNDLTRINFSPAKVVRKKSPLHVPGLVHQFSVIESKLSNDNTLADILYSLYPGGSITGAPKKNVMKLIKEIEKGVRGFYCGSTVLMYKNSLTASINIRSAEVDFLQKELKYGSGGGITLESNAQSEYDEILAKLKSFLLLLS